MPIRRRSLLLTGFLLGVGIIAFVDEAIFHQLLQWHAFYWGTDEHGRILSDGLFHVFSTGLLLWGGYRLWQTPRDWIRGSAGPLVAAILIGAGAFNAYDGIVQHVLLHLHLVDEYVCASPQANNSVASCPNDIPLEIIWIAVGTALVVIGTLWWRRSSPRSVASTTFRDGGAAQAA
jgi:uncharacterized membrane protein